MSSPARLSLSTVWLAAAIELLITTAHCTQDKVHTTTKAAVMWIPTFGME